MALYGGPSWQRANRWNWWNHWKLRISRNYVWQIECKNTKGIFRCRSKAGAIYHIGVFATMRNSWRAWQYNQAPNIPETLQNTQSEKQLQPVWNPINRILNLSNEELPYHTCYYGKPIDSDVYGLRKSNADGKTCDHYFKKYGEHKKEEWLQCPICTYWFHHTHFHI